MRFRIHLFRVASVAFSCGVLAPVAVGLGPDAEIERFGKTPIRIADTFATDTREKYLTKGDIAWSKGSLVLSPQASLGRVCRIDPLLDVKFTLEPRSSSASGRCDSRIALLLGGQREIVIAIRRTRHGGRLYRHVAIAQIDPSRAEPTKPEAKVLRVLPSFTYGGGSERWLFRYRNGLVEIFCEGQRIGTAYSTACASWIYGVSLTQAEGTLACSEFALSGMETGY